MTENLSITLIGIAVIANGIGAIYLQRQIRMLDRRIVELEKRVPMGSK